MPARRARPVRADEGVRVFDRSSLREIDRLSAEEFGIPTIVLMENAGCAVAEVAIESAREAGPGARILVACGPGSNGGDGYVAARHLHNAGFDVRIAAGEGAAPRGDAGINHAICRAMGLEFLGQELAGWGEDPPEVIVDALLGTGASGAPRGWVARAIDAINAWSSRGSVVVSADVPSGLDADLGVAPGPAVRASVTVSFVGLKVGFLTLGAQEFVGTIALADIGAPRELVRRLGRPLPEHAERSSGPGVRRRASGPRRPGG